MSDKGTSEMDIYYLIVVGIIIVATAAVIRSCMVTEYRLKYGVEKEATP